MRYHTGYLVVLFFLLFADQGPVFSQPHDPTGNPYIRSLYTRPFGIENNNLSIVQDSLGIIYIGNSHGLLQFDGSHWQRLSRQSDPILAKGNDGSLYAGFYKNFGRLCSSSRGVTFESLLDSSVLEGKTSGIVCSSNHIYFTSGPSLFQYNGKSIQHIKTFRGSVQLFGTRNRVFVYQHPDRLYCFRKGRLNKTISIREIKASVAAMIDEGRDRWLLILDDGRALNLNPAGRLTPAWSLKKKVTITHAISLNNRIVLGTESNGILFCDSTGVVTRTINNKSGLLDIKINRLFVDRDGDLWALHPTGISIVSTSPAIRLFSRQNGIKGVVNSVTRYDHTLYAATSQGIYYMPDSRPGEGSSRGIFRKVSAIHSEVFDFYHAKGRLFAASRQGIFQIDGGRARLFYNRHAGHYTNVHPYRHKPGFIVVGLEEGLSVVRYTRGLFIDQGTMKGVNGQVTDLEENHNGAIWVTTQYNGFYRIDSLPGGIRRVKHFSESESFGPGTHWVKPYALADRMIFSTSNGLFRFDPATGNFTRDTILPVDDENNLIYPMVEDPSHNLWINAISKGNAPKQTIHAFFRENNGLGKNRHFSLDIMQGFQVHSIHPQQGSIIWVGGNSGLIRINTQELNKEKDHGRTLLHRALTNGDSLLASNYAGSRSSASMPEIPYSQNNLVFEFSRTHYTSASQPMFQTRLAGYQKEWSEWSPDARKEYTNLHEGDYSFEVRSRNSHGEISPVLQYRFQIRPPVYRTWYAWLVYLTGVGLIIWGIIHWRSRYFAREKKRLESIIRQRTHELEKEKDKADKLIERMLPKETAEELKAGVKTKPYFYNKITVLFGDIQGFTKITEQMGRGRLIDRLNQCFLEFDHIVEKYRIEKIKTIGDAYMCAGGIPHENQTHPIETILAAMEMQAFMHQVGTGENHNNIWDIRIGIDTGPVVAGVIGRNKISYDIWGSTVNMASRMEALSEPGKINISGNTYTLVKDFFLCQYRGRMPVKNGGEVDMYFVEGLKPQFAIDMKGLKPNESFHTNLQLLRLNDLEEKIFEKLEQLPPDLFYHNLKHTVDVVTQVELIGKAEGVSAHDLLMLKTAALFHDTGHLVSYDRHEEEGVKMAREMLPDYHYSPQQIDQVERLIMATRMPPNPQDLLEEIICDADLDYLGRTDFLPVAYNLYKELKTRNKVESFEDWKKIQMDFIRNHSYFTNTARNLREVNKNKQLERILEELRDKNGSSRKKR
jgi:class 3 adenylate cyclase/ligand-binding sensor domain-containing protein/predicted metal-dependent HD superfamily phosphohydrolase